MDYDEKINEEKKSDENNIYKNLLIKITYCFNNIIIFCLII